MKIKSYKKIKNGKYQIEFNNLEKIEAYEDVILKLDLLLKKEISKDMIIKIHQGNQKYESYFTALKYLNVRARSKKEISNCLLEKNFSEDSIKYTIDLLEEQGYIDDLNFARIFLNNKLITTSNGPYKIKNDLREKGVSDEVIDEVMKEYRIDIQKEKIKKQINRMIKSNKNRGNKQLLLKMFNDLSKEGFKRSLINEMLQDIELEDDSDLLKKEYEKLYKKLSRKYQGQELEFKIRQKLYQKGFESFQ